LEGVKTQDDLAGPGGLMKELTKALVERMLAGELTHHLGYEKHDAAEAGNGNTRNGKSRKNWERVIPSFQFPEEVRKVIYTTNAVESLHASLRKVTRNRGSFPSEEAAFKLLYLALRNASKKWFWKEAMPQFEMIYPGRRDAARAA
jgi:transposase-like protein